MLSIVDAERIVPSNELALIFNKASLNVQKSMDSWAKFRAISERGRGASGARRGAQCYFYIINSGEFHFTAYYVKGEATAMDELISIITFTTKATNLG